ncbi:MAG: phosphatase PAP2 family protein [Lachnospiraceae bacterium]|nr:phosphatase PAP2 family protein [Lachnospiraceae bacterium]
MPFLTLDADILLYIQDHIRSGFLDKIFPNITFLGDAGIFWIALTAVLLCFKKTRRAAVCSMIALVGSLLLNNILLKPLVNRVRPYEVIDGLVLIGKKATDGSFPSGHTAASIASAVAMCRYLKKRWSVPLIVLALMISFSRLYIGIHYPTDVLAGLLDGILLAVIAWVIESRLYRGVPKYAAFAGATEIAGKPADSEDKPADGGETEE